MDDAMKNYEYDGKNYVYTDKNTNVTYKFDQEKNEWIVKDENDKSEENKSEQVDNVPPNPTTSQNPIYGFENDTHTYTDPNDGSVYMWDREKNAWFPKVCNLIFPVNILILFYQLHILIKILKRRKANKIKFSIKCN